jgi:hypothetical protein
MAIEHGIVDPHRKPANKDVHESPALRAAAGCRKLRAEGTETEENSEDPDGRMQHRMDQPGLGGEHPAPQNRRECSFHK